jgi:hypothetical protein
VSPNSYNYLTEEVATFGQEENRYLLCRTRFSGISLPQASTTLSRKTVKNVRQLTSSLSIKDIVDRIHDLPFSGEPIMFDGAIDYDRLRSSLVDSFSQQYNMGLVIRPIRLGKRTSLPIFIERINFDLQSCLIKIHSRFKGYNSETEDWDVDIGIGLCSTRNIPSGEKIVYFCGEILARDSEEFIDRWENGNKQLVIILFLFYLFFL